MTACCKITMALKERTTFYKNPDVHVEIAHKSTGVAWLISHAIEIKLHGNCAYINTFTWRSKLYTLKVLTWDTRNPDMRKGRWCVVIPLVIVAVNLQLLLFNTRRTVVTRADVDTRADLTLTELLANNGEWSIRHTFTRADVGNMDLFNAEQVFLWTS